MRKPLRVSFYNRTHGRRLLITPRQVEIRGEILEISFPFRHFRAIGETLCPEGWYECPCFCESIHGLTFSEESRKEEPAVIATSDTELRLIFSPCSKG